MSTNGDLHGEFEPAEAFDDRNAAADDIAAVPMDSALDSIDDAFLRGQLHASLFGTADPGVWVDRFELVEKLGVGGMGSVWAARDDRLRRRVALKFLRSHLDGSVGEQRLFREAQALARMAHPNVVAVFDVGRHDGRVWIAMEHVPGQTLRQWVEGQDRGPRQVLARWLAAGEGLAAMHAAGLIHRDVKPDNILLGDDGRVRVIDFGLVRALESHGGVDALETVDSVAGLGRTAHSGDGTSGSVCAGGLESTRGFVGTPAYAAPEQRDGEQVDPRADQYSFCVSLWEALTGQRPERAAKQRASGLPRRVERALLRGLEREPERRFEDMPALLHALAPRRSQWVVAGMFAALAAGLGGGLAMRTAPSAEDPCVAAGDAVEQQWTATRRRWLQRGLNAELATGAIAALDDWAARWQSAAVASCEEVHVRHERSTTVLDRRRACLERGLLTFDGVVEEIGGLEADGAGLGPLLDALDGPELCMSEAVAEAQFDRPPPAIAQRVSEAERELLGARLGTRERALAGRIARAQAIEAEAAQLDWSPLAHEASMVVAALSKQLRRTADARAAYGRALDRATQLHDQRGYAAAMAGMTELAIDDELDERAASWSWARQREAVAFLGDAPREQAVLARQLGHLHLLRGDPEAAEAAMREAVAAWERAGPAHAWGLASGLRHLAKVLVLRGDAEQAKALLSRATDLEHFGEARNDGSSRSFTTRDEGITAMNTGDLDGAERLLRRALAQARGLQGPRGVDVARALLALSALDDARGRPAEGREWARQADEIYVAARGPEHPERALALIALGTAEFRLEDFDAAAREYELALTVLERGEAPNPLERGPLRLNLAETYLKLERRPRAERFLDLALTDFEGAIPDDHPIYAVALKLVGDLRLGEARLDDARAALERAAAIHAKDPGSYPVEEAELRWLLARLEVEADDWPAAQAQAERARDGFEALARDSDTWQARADEITQFIAKNTR